MAKQKAEQTSYPLQLVPEAILTEISRVLLSWAELEFQFHSILLGALMTGDSGHIPANVKKVMGQDLNRQVNALKDHLRADRKLSEALHDIGNTLGHLKSQRNDRDLIAHSLWRPFVDADTNEVSPTKAVALSSHWRANRHEHKVIELDRLKQIVQRNQQLYWKLFDLQLDLASARHAERQA